MSTPHGSGSHVVLPRSNPQRVTASSFIAPPVWWCEAWFRAWPLRCQPGPADSGPSRCDPGASRHRPGGAGRYFRAWALRVRPGPADQRAFRVRPGTCCHGPGVLPPFGDARRLRFASLSTAESCSWVGGLLSSSRSCNPGVEAPVGAEPARASAGAHQPGLPRAHRGVSGSGTGQPRLRSCGRLRGGDGVRAACCHPLAGASPLTAAQAAPAADQRFHMHLDPEDNLH